MNYNAFQKIIQLHMKRDFPFVINNFPHSVEYDGIQLDATVNLLVTDKFIKENLHSWCIEDGVDICDNFTIDLMTFAMCSEKPIDYFLKMKRAVSNSYALLTGDAPHLSDIRIYFSVECG